jgi:hypothetical protein
MSKSTPHTLLVPGESGWELWTRQNDAPFSLHTATEQQRAIDVGAIPSGPLTLLFPVRSLTAVPMRVTSDDDALFPDLAALHAERLGLRPDPMAGQLTDVFVVSREAESTVLLSVFLRPPGEGELPAKSPQAFDLSVRAFPVEGDAVVVWREFGRWVFAIVHHGHAVHFQATTSDTAVADESIAREIRLALVQLSMQGIHPHADRILLWTSSQETDATALQRILNLPVQCTPRPAPVLPDTPSKLLPADVRAARRAATKRRNAIVGIAAAAALYLGLIGWFAFGIWSNHREAARLAAEAEALAPDAAAYALHNAKWQELLPVVDLANAPVDILYRIATRIPPGLRLKNAEISADEIKLQGEAQQLQAVNNFSLGLTKHNELTRFTWETPEPNQSSRGWEFVYSGEIPGIETQE